MFIQIMINTLAILAMIFYGFFHPSKQIQGWYIDQDITATNNKLFPVHHSSINLLFYIL
jgi:hypothetical protein